MMIKSKNINSTNTDEICKCVKCINLIFLLNLKFKEKHLFNYIIKCINHYINNRDLNLSHYIYIYMKFSQYFIKDFIMQDYMEKNYLIY